MNDDNKQIYAAMAKAWPEIEGAVKGSTNPHFRSKYSDLESVIDAIKPALSKHGLWFMQCPEVRYNTDTNVPIPGVFISTRICHESGEYILCGTLYVPTGKNDAQAIGSATTYGRRYALTMIFGVPSVDDDGEGAMNRPAKPEIVDDGTLLTLREASMDGTEALMTAFKNLRTKPGFNTIWSAHSEGLKKAAEAADDAAKT